MNWDLENPDLPPLHSQPLLVQPISQDRKVSKDYVLSINNNGEHNPGYKTWALGSGNLLALNLGDTARKNRYCSESETISTSLSYDEDRDSPYRTTTTTTDYHTSRKGSSNISNDESSPLPIFNSCSLTFSLFRHFLIFVVAVTVLITLGWYLVSLNSDKSSGGIDDPPTPIQASNNKVYPETTQVKLRGTGGSFLTPDAAAREKTYYGDAEVTRVRRNVRDIKSPEDLKTLTDCRSLRITQLVDDDPPAAAAPKTPEEDNNDSITELLVAGPTSEDWLEYVLKSFKSVKDISLDIDQMCIGSKVVQRDSLPPLELSSFEILRIQNAHLCPMMNWIFRWRMPNLKEIRIENADINRLTFGPLEKFIELNRATLETVTIRRSFLCPDCSFSHGLKRAVRVHVVDQKEHLDYSEYDF